MDAIGRLAGGVAHDFNDILTAVMGYSERLVLALSREESLRGDVVEIGRAAYRAAELTRQLLAFSRRQVLQPKVVDLNVVVEGKEKMLHRLIGEHIELTVRLMAGLSCVRADVGQIEQVILNLAVNARDAMPDGGKLTAETANVTLSQQYAATHPEVAPGEYVLLAVSDDGCGMTDEIKAHIFEPFFTTKEQGKGHRPRSGHLLRHRQTKRRPHQRVQRTRPRHDVQGLPAVRQRGGNGIDLVVTDVVMPQMGGKELADRLRETCPDTKVLFTSGYTEDAIVNPGVLQPGIAFLQKPYTPGALAA